jgi:hypothetical protein
MEQQQYGQECIQELVEAGFPELTPKQAILILEPIHAPENFYQDGELSEAMAKKIWKTNLRLSQLSNKLIDKAEKFVFD